MTNSPKNIYISPELEAATGKLDYPMINDYMFRAVMQSNNKALTGLISSLLHIRPEDISSVEITNPIVLGNACKDKEFRLDINMVLNNRELINLELQVERKVNWTERSTNKFMNTKTHKIYSDKLTLHVLDLNHTELATQEDKAWGIDYWAELFKATTWEELKMIAQSNEYMAEAANSIFRMNADDMMRKSPVCASN